MLERLSDVQNRDLELDTLHEEKGQTPPELIDIRAREARLQERLALKQQEHAELRRRVSRNELELEALEGRRKAASESALRASSSKEASQFQNQELQFATRIQELEEDTLPLMEQLERLAGDVNGLQEELDEVAPLLAELTAQEEARLESIDASIARIVGERNALADSIDRALVRQYEQVRRARRGLGLVEIINNERCGGCNVKLPIHVIQKARRGVGVTRCPSCGRILWAKE